MNLLRLIRAWVRPDGLGRPAGPPRGPCGGRVNEPELSPSLVMLAIETGMAGENTISDKANTASMTPAALEAANQEAYSLLPCHRRSGACHFLYNIVRPAHFKANGFQRRDNRVNAMRLDVENRAIVNCLDDLAHRKNGFR